MTRRLVATLAVAAAATAAVPAAGCGADDVTPRAAVAEAAQATQQAQTARMTLRVTLSGAGTPLPLSVGGSGVTTLSGSPRADVTLDFTPLLRLAGAAGDGRTRVLVPGGSTVYVDPPAVQGLDLPGGRQWLALDLARTARALGVDPAGLAALARIDPATQLAGLRAAGSIEEVGEEEVGGVTTTHYRGDVRTRDFARALPPERRRAVERALRDLAEATGDAALDAPTPTDLWVDEDGLARRMRQTSVIPAPGGGRPGRVEVTYELSDFGTPVRPQVPGARSVLDVTRRVTRALPGGALGAG